MKRSIYNVGFLVTGVFVIFILYFILQSAFNTVLFPTIGEIGTRFLDFFHVKGLISFGYTLLRLLISLAISFVVSIGISYLYFLFKPSLMIFKPLMFLLKVSPIVAIVLYVQVLTASSSMLAPYVVTTMIMIPLMTEAYVSGINSIDKTILDVLKLEGANRSYQFFKIIFPMMIPAVVAQIILWFFAGYNDYFGPLIYLQSQDNFTLQRVLQNIASQADANMPKVMSTCIISLIPALIIYAVAQKALLKGIALEGIKK